MLRDWQPDVLAITVYYFFARKTRMYPARELPRPGIVWGDNSTLTEIGPDFEKLWVLLA